jgi:hypothetical protein
LLGFGTNIPRQYMPGTFGFGSPDFTCIFVLFAENKKAGREEEKKSKYAILFVWFVVNYS